MKVIVSHNIPFYLAHGGQQTLIESLIKELSALGVDIQHERWWDSSQTGEILHYVGRPTNLHLAKQKGFMTIMTENFDTVASESRGRLFARTVATKIAKRFSPGIKRRLSFYKDLDALVYVVPHELDVVCKMYGVSRQDGFIIAHGLERHAIQSLSEPQLEGNYLVCVGTICPRKNTVLLAKCAREAKVPIVFLGKPFSDDDPYFRQFRQLIDDKYVQYPGYVSEVEKYRILRGARGFALLSLGESGCIAIYEAAAARLPLLLSNLPWAQSGYPASDRLHYVSPRNQAGIVSALKNFYSIAHRGGEMTFPVGTWTDVAMKYLDIYKSVLQKRIPPDGADSKL